jgi:hypothetical protein
MVPEFPEYAKAAELQTGEAVIPFIEQFDDTAQSYWLASQLGKPSPVSLNLFDDPRF